MSWDCFIKLYSEQLRIPLFSGLFSLAAFLFTMKTFIIVKMKEGLYDSDEYQELIQKKRARKEKHTFYGGLIRLAKLLTAAVFASVIAAVSQITLGFIEKPWPVVISLFLAVLAIVLLVVAIMLSSSNLHEWFEQLEKKAVDKEKKAIEIAEKKVEEKTNLPVEDE